MPHDKFQPGLSDSLAINEQAAAWVARRDRGLTAVEQDDYLQWLAANPRHVDAVTQHGAAFERMMKLYEWQPGQSGAPNPDLFARRRPKPHWNRVVLLAATAAAMVLGAMGWQRSTRPAGSRAPTAYVRVNEQRALTDGSVVELNDGSRVDVEFSPTERRVRLTGEAHFRVAKDPRRPFVVDARGVAVRAVGTEFNVRIERESVQVLVTEGSVTVRPPTKDHDAAASVADLPLVSAGQRAVVNLSSPVAADITEVTTAQIAAALDWHGTRLQFFETPLAIAVAEFNARNRVQIQLGQDDLNRIPIGGTFRADNVEAFVRLLEATLDLKSDVTGSERIVLTRPR